MAPIPATIDEETQETLKRTRRRQIDLVESQIPRLRQCTGPLAAQQALAADVRDDLDTFARLLESLSLIAEDSRSPNLRREVDDLNKSLTRLRQDFRTALLESARNVKAQARANRDELLRSSAASQEKGAGANEKITEDVLMRANNDVTDALRRTVAAMQNELERSVLSTQMLESSTASLKATSSAHDTLTNVMGTSKQLLAALERTDWLDRLLILSAMFFFCIVVLLIVKERVFDRSMRIAFWWTRLIPNFSGDVELLDQLEKGAAQATASLSSIVAEVSDTLTEAGSTLTESMTSSTPTTSLVQTIASSPTTILSQATEAIHNEL
ncbi:Sec20-domain-containing protein [Schizophyllum commune H4-8]|uniref:Sec20-domain-containing protein n=1 Tax=Schizophyllum commune (strain H4-8 / FGSC 9210) TaxID=578458 RepID=UPI0021601EAA|nr:Sec20-domain-containing protein [Schizophyllum commune H4-8]KAI5887057.1 Sec20-domain-containing protein [Schizophyllum commune H4-8]